MATTAIEDEGASTAEHLPRWLAYCVSFWGGFQIMALEICGFRVLATNVGSSVIVTGALLSAIMVTLCAGYLVGGVLSARLKSSRMLFVLLLVAAAYTQIVTSLLFEPIVAHGLSLKTALAQHAALGAILSTVFVAAALYAVPISIMSMISPYLITLFTTARPGREQETGARVGFFMSLSTLGSIIGTLASSYVFIPSVGVERTALATNALLLCLAAAGWVCSARAERRLRVTRWNAAFSLTFLVCLALGLRANATARDPSVVYEAESHYGQIQIVERRDDAQRRMLLYHPSRFFTHSLLYPEEPLRDLPELMYLMPTRLKPPANILVLGSAAGGILRRIELVFPEAHVVAVDVDPKVHEVARDIFQVNTRQSTLVTADARMHLSADTQRYDLIIVDLFAGEYVPSHCITVEFFQQLREHLTARGGVFLNSNMQDIQHELPAGAEPFRPVRHLESTLRAAGFESLFENSFFQSIFAFPFDLLAATLRDELFAAFRDPRLAAPLRAAAGVAAHTTLSIPKYEREYRPFTDHYLPTLLIERKTNAAAVYGTLEQLGGEAPPNPYGVLAAEVARVVLQVRWAESMRSGQPSLRDVGALLGALNEIESPLTPAAIDVAAAYFRFPGHRDVLGTDVVASSPWARLASQYAELYVLAYGNEYEAVLPHLELLERTLGRR